MSARRLQAARCLGAASLAAAALLGGASLAEDPSAGGRHGSAAAATGLDLLECYRLALTTSEKYGIAHENREQALLQKDRALALVMPKVTGKYQYNRQEEIPSFGGASGGTGGFSTSKFSPLERREWWLVLEQPIFAGGREFLARRQAADVIDSRSASLEQARLDLFAETAAAFYTVVAAERSVQTLDSSVALQKDRLAEIRARQEVGLARRTEVLLIETQLAKDESSLTRARNLLESGRAVLGFLIGRPVEAPLDDAFHATDPAPPLESLIGEAQSRRRDLAALEADVRAAEHAVKIITHEAWGTLRLEGNYYGRREGFQEPVDWDVALMADVPFFTGGDRKARAADAVSKMRQAELLRDELKRAIARQVTEAWLDLQTTDSVLASLEAEVRSADENHRLLQEEYRQGLATNLEVFTARNLLQESSVQREVELSRRKAAWVRLHATAGSIPGVSLD